MILYDFCCFLSVSVNIVDKLLFKKNIFPYKPPEAEERYSMRSHVVFVGRTSDHDSADAQEVCLFCLPLL